MLKKLIVLFFFPTISYANDLNIMSCEYNDHYKTACRINSVTLSENEIFQMEFEVNYVYECKGHNSAVGVQTEIGFYPFLRGSGVQTVIATGQARLYTSILDSSSFYSKIFNKSCVLEIKNVQKKPSLQTILNWENQSKEQIKLLNSELVNFQLASDLEDIENWNLQKLMLMKKNISFCVNTFPRNPHFKLLASTVQNAIENAPIKKIPNVLKESIVNYYRNKLEIRMNESEELLDKMQAWSISDNKEFDEAIKNIRESIN